MYVLSIFSLSLINLINIMVLLSPNNCYLHLSHSQVHPDDPWAADRGFLTEVFVSTYQRRRSQREALNALPLYPSEALLWDEGQIPSQSYSGARPLALMKLNLQFLTPVDYLLRNFHLFRLEAAYEVREDIAVGLGLRA
jgi:intron-binding protein aquarius